MTDFSGVIDFLNTMTKLMRLISSKIGPHSLVPISCLLNPDQADFYSALRERLYNPPMPEFILTNTSFMSIQNMTGIGPNGAVPFWLEGNLPTINISVGSPPQIISVTLDTGSSLTYLPAQNDTSTSEGNTFDYRKSKSWAELANTQNLTIDSRECEVHLGIDHISLSNTKFLVPLGLNQHCERRNGVLGLNKHSDYLQAIANLSNFSTILSFAYDDPNTGKGWFSIGGYAGLDPREIIWTSQSPYKKDPVYRVSVPYITHAGRRKTFKKGHTAIINTVSPFGFLPTSMMGAYISTKFYPSFRHDKDIKPRKLFNMTGISRPKYPVMSLRLGPAEYLSEMVDEHTLGNIADFLLPEYGTEIYLPTFLTSGILGKRGDDESVVGANFLRMLKGVVIDFTPGKEKVGFIPREWRGSRSGFLNPAGSGASSGKFGVGGVVLAAVCVVGVMVVIA
jgi:hypothetical protein